MKKLSLSLLLLAFITACVDLPDLIPNGDGDESDMVLLNPNVSIVNQGIYPYTIPFNDSINITLSLASGEECADINIAIENGQILKESGNYEFYTGLSNSSLMGNATAGEWKAKYKISKRQPIPTILCTLEHTIVPNKDVYLGFRVKFSDNNWHYGWLLLSTGESILPPLTLKTIGYNKSAGTNVRIGG